MISVTPTPVPGQRPLKAAELTGAVLMVLREVVGVTRKAVALRAGVNHATLRLAELTPHLVRLTADNGARVLRAYRDLGLAVWIEDRPATPLKDRAVTIVDGRSTAVLAAFRTGRRSGSPRVRRP